MKIGSSVAFTGRNITFLLSSVILSVTLTAGSGLDRKPEIRETSQVPDKQALVNPAVVTLPGLSGIQDVRTNRVRAVHKQREKHLQTRATEISALQDRHQGLSGRKPQVHYRMPAWNLPFTDAVPRGLEPASNREDRSVFYDSGMLSLSDSAAYYFQFESGLNGGDTLDMDVMISSNEGLNFGSEGGGYPWYFPAFTNPSLLYYLSPDSSLSTVTSVPLVTDPNYTWTTISWDWNGGNGGGYLQPGNVWVVYTRTTQCYVVMEITAADSTAGWFAFNYKYQTDGTNQFGSLTNVIDVQVNGADADTITQGDAFVVTVTFSDGSTSADVAMWVDMNGNGLLEPGTDFDLDEDGYIEDNDWEDEDPATGVYQITFSGDEDGPNRVSNFGLFLQATDFGGSDYAYLYIDPIASDYSLSGQVTPAFANILIFAVSMEENPPNDPEPWMTVTDVTGAYQNFLPDSGTYFLMAFDFLGVTSGMFPDTAYEDIWVDGHLSGFDFEFITPTSAVQGYVRDENQTPLPGIWVWVDFHDGPGLGDETDATGFYSIGVPEGEFRIGLDMDYLIPGHLVPKDTMVYIPPDDTVGVDFTAYTTNSTISGTVFLDGNPIPGIRVNAHSRLGWTETESGPGGGYILSVSSLADGFGGYGIEIHDWENLPPNVLLLDHPQHVLSGSTGIDLHLVTMPGMFSGHVYDGQTFNPIWAWIHMFNDIHDIWWGTGDNGEFHIPSPNGFFNIEIGSEGYYVLWDSIQIQDNVVYRDYYLQPVSFDGSVSGTVYDDQTMTVLEGVEVNIGNDWYWDQTWTDATGHYHFDVPFGVFGMHAYKDNYGDDWVDHVVVNSANPHVQQDFYLHPLTIDAVVRGIVRDGETSTPIRNAWVSAWNEYFWVGTSSGPDGFFYLDVPSGDSLMVQAEAGGYHPSMPNVLFLNPGDSAWLEIDLWPQVIQPPMLQVVVDVPHDQGRQVRLVWTPGDPDWQGSWVGYSIWRQVPFTDPPLWDYVDMVPFHGMEMYSYVAPTLVDSNHVTGPTGEFWTTFMVSAHTHNPWEFFDSNWMSGYSVDNLHPAVPGGLAAMVTAGNDGIRLHWNPVPDADFDYYSIFRGSSSGFIPGTAWAHTIDTTFVDQNVTAGQTYYYVIMATDFNGNSSDYSPEVNATILGLQDPAGLPREYALLPNHPNPFNPATTFAYALPHPGKVTIKVYNILGEEITTLVNEFRDAGRYTATWNAQIPASGVYLVQMRSGTFIDTRKVMLLK